ncbi:hypothetical protein TWF594_002469 [Orbilia oligospora]|nr:hypothetical protein TWF594_002469 [Orbilia oligospora]
MNQFDIDTNKNPTAFTKYIFLANFLRSEESILKSPSYASPSKLQLHTNPEYKRHLHNPQEPEYIPPPHPLLNHSKNTGDYDYGLESYTVFKVLRSAVVGL